MGLTQAKTHNRQGEPYEVKGGYITLVEDRVWRGVVRRKKDNAVLWICDHIHSRPEYNARHPDDDRQVWEYSALNCGREAADQWDQRGTSQGAPPPIGIIGRAELSPNYFGEAVSRADTKTVVVGQMSFWGSISLLETGTRRLRLASNPGQPETPETMIGYIDPDNPTDDSGWPDVGSRELAHWVTAAGLLLDFLWGLTFRSPGIGFRAEEPDYDIIRRLTPKRRSQAKKGNPHVRPKREGGSRLYEVVDSKGKVVVTLPHRGKALKELERLEAKG